MRSTLLAGVAYFGIVMGVGFALGVIRVPLVVPRIGERWAELLEMPLMAVTIFYSASYILRHFPDAATRRNSLIAGFVALSFAIVSEVSLVVLIQNEPLAQYIASRDKVSGIAYLLLLILFALMPRLRLSSNE